MANLQDLEEGRNRFHWPVIDGFNLTEAAASASWILIEGHLNTSVFSSGANKHPKYGPLGQLSACYNWASFLVENGWPIYSPLQPARIRSNPVQFGAIQPSGHVPGCTDAWMHGCLHKEVEEHAMCEAKTHTHTYNKTKTFPIISNRN